MSQPEKIPDTTVKVTSSAGQLPGGVVNLAEIKPLETPGTKVFIHYNGPTDQLSGICAGMAILDPGASPHEPHRHPEEEFLLISEGTGEIECDGKTTRVGPGSMMYTAGNTLHGVTNTGKTPMTFYWSKWMAKSAS